MLANVSFRSNGFIWGVRIVQAIFALVLLGICVSNASDWHSIQCSTPSKLGYHIAMAAITLLPLAYFILCTGPASLTKWWSPWTQIALDALFIIFWIVAAGLSDYDCDGLCSACSAGGARVDTGFGFDVSIGSLLCSCYFPGERRRSLLDELVGRATSSASRPSRVSKEASSIATKKGLDASMIFLFFVTLLTAIYLKYGSSNARAQNTATSTAVREEEHVGRDVEMAEESNNVPQNTTGNY